MEDPTHSQITDKQAAILDELEVLAKDGVSPTVRSLADRLEERTHRSERWTDGEIRGLLERLEEKGHVVQYTDDDSAQRYKLAE